MERHKSTMAKTLPTSSNTASNSNTGNLMQRLSSKNVQSCVCFHTVLSIEHLDRIWPQVHLKIIQFDKAKEHCWKCSHVCVWMCVCVLLLRVSICILVFILGFSAFLWCLFEFEFRMHLPSWCPRYWEQEPSLSVWTGIQVRAVCRDICSRLQSLCSSNEQITTQPQQAPLTKAEAASVLWALCSLVLSQ